MYTSPYKWKRILFYGIYNNNRSDNGKNGKGNEISESEHV